MAEMEKNSRLPHSLILEEREHLSVSGVLNVEQFNEECVLLETVCGRLSVRGQELHVERLQLEAGELTVTGEIALMEYEDTPAQKGSWLARLFG